MHLLPACPAEILGSAVDTLMSFQLEYGEPPEQRGLPEANSKQGPLREREIQ